MLAGEPCSPGGARWAHAAGFCHTVSCFALPPPSFVLDALPPGLLGELQFVSLYGRENPAFPALSPKLDHLAQHNKGPLLGTVRWVINSQRYPLAILRTRTPILSPTAGLSIPCGQGPCRFVLRDVHCAWHSAWLVMSGQPAISLQSVCTSSES